MQAFPLSPDTSCKPPSPQHQSKACRWDQWLVLLGFSTCWWQTAFLHSRAIYQEHRHSEAPCIHSLENKLLERKTNLYASPFPHTSSSEYNERYSNLTISEGVGVSWTWASRLSTDLGHIPWSQRGHTADQTQAVAVGSRERLRETRGICASQISWCSSTQPRSGVDRRSCFERSYAWICIWNLPILKILSANSKSTT